MRISKTFGSRLSHASDEKRVKESTDWEAQVVLAEETSAVQAPQSNNVNPSSQDDTAQQPTTKLTTLDAIAKGSLSPSSLARYEAYKLALIGSEEDPQSVAHTLAVFIRDLFLESSETRLH